ncbi:MAG: sugar phosphate nucleotidyltransferase [Planctomycetota bacterium]
MNLKGVVLAGGLGTRLQPLTKITNKHLLPVYDQPMIYYPIRTLVRAGISEILLVTGGEHAGDFLRLLGNGKEFGLERMHYAYQEGEGGIAEALGLAKSFADGSPICVMLGDNLIQDDLTDAARDFDADPNGAMLMLKEVEDPERFGVARFENDKLVEIIEKPETPPSNMAVTGIYFYDARVFEIIPGLERSQRGELEITDVNNDYIRRNALVHRELRGWWTDAGTFPSLHRASKLVAESAEEPGS